MMQHDVVSLRRDSADDPSRAVRDAYTRLRKASEADPYPSAEVREDWLDRLVRILQRERTAFVDAVRADFGSRSEVETLSADVLMTLEAIRHSRHHVRSWMKRRHVAPQWYMRPGRAWIDPQPLGVVGVIAPWNYPVNLAIAPLAAALAAGNRAILKPSEFTPRTSELMANLLRDAFSPDEIAVVNGGPEVARTITQLPLDHILFTGSTQVGTLVAKAAADNLVPVTLELGGKSPALMHPSYDVTKFADRVAMGKMFNAGQTCIAPDYVLLPKGREQHFADVFTNAVRRAESRDTAPGMTSVIHDRAFARLTSLIEDARAQGGRIIETGAIDRSARRMPPVLVLNANAEMIVMNEEIFGPILPVVTYASIDEAMHFIRARPRPLALYYFDDDERRVNDLLRKTVSGGVCINDTLLHFAQDELPFGGVGPSGMGRYHGERGFEAFSHLKGVYQQSDLSPTPKLLTLPLNAIRKALDVLIGGRVRRPGE